MVHGNWHFFQQIDLVLIISGFLRLKGDTNDRRSTTKYVFFIRVGAILWNYKRQPTIARSTMEVEYMVGSHCAIEVC